MALVPGRAAAHGFKADAESYQAFLEGTGVIFEYPPAILPLAALGVTLSLWSPEGLPRVVGFAIGGLLLGVFLAPAAGPWVVFAALAAGLAAALAGSLALGRGLLPMAVLSVAACAAVMALSFEGHGLGELPLMINLGIFLAALLALVAPAGLVRISFDQLGERAWLRIGWRIVCSWLAAILLLYAAFLAAG